MLLALILLGLFGPIIVSGTFTCSGSDWVSDGSKCYKIIPGSPSDGQNLCNNEDPNASLFLAPSSEAANKLDTLFSGEKIWVGLRYRNGAEWIWDNGSNETVTWGSTPILPQLCITVSQSGLMYDYDCYKLRGLVCQKGFYFPGSCEVGWTNFGSYCFKILRLSNNGVDFNSARILCSDEGAHIMMAKSQMYAAEIVTGLGMAICWGGLTDFDADHIYTWEDDTNISQTSLFFAYGEPNRRDLDYVCAYIQDGKVYNHACTTSERVICEIDATKTNIDTTSSQEIIKTHSIMESLTLTTETDLLVTTSVQLSTNTETPVESSTPSIRQSAVSTTVSTTKEPVSTIESETSVVPENLSTALKVSAQISPVSSKTTEHLQMPTQTTKYTDAATAQQTHTQTNRLIPTTLSSPIGKSKCTQSSTNSCRCQKRIVANTTENQKMQTLKVTDYIWLNKCTMQPLIDSGMVNVENCPYVCKCSPKGSTTSQEEMFACVRRP